MAKAKKVARRVIGTDKTKTGAGHIATGSRKAMRRSGKPVAGKVKVVKTTSGYAAVYQGKDWKPRK